MADRAAARAEAAESVCQQLQQQLQVQAQQQQRLTSKESTTKEQLKHLRSDGDARVIAEREVSHTSVCRRQPLCGRISVPACGGGDVTHVTLVRAAGEDWRGIRSRKS